jgi:hypothetical protein
MMSNSCLPKQEAAERISPDTVKRDSSFAKLWLALEIRGGWAFN